MGADPRELIAARLGASRRFAVTSHLRPDGDSLCTALALAGLGALLGKQVDIVNRDPTPVPFSSFPELAGVRVGQIRAADYDTVVLLECADVSRSGQEGLDGAFKINIDHHYSNTPYADINWIDPEAPAVGEMVFELSRFLGVRPTPEIAENLYCAIFSDTGSFHFSNTTPRALAAATELARLGASPNRVAEKITYNNRPEKILLLGRFKEMGPETYRVSLRSKGSANAAKVAEHFGGGGHVHASGFTVHGPYERLIREVPATVEDLLRDARLDPNAGRAG